MRQAIAVIAVLISVAAFSKALAQDPDCRLVMASGAGFVVECGKQLYSYNLSLSQSSGTRREVRRDIHGRFTFLCPADPKCRTLLCEVESNCENEPTVGGSFVAPAEWLSSSKDEQAILQVFRNMPWPGGDRPPTPSASCPVFDVSVGGLNGRAVCFSEGKGSTVLVVAANDNVGFLLWFAQDDKPAPVLKSKMLEMLPRFEIERATGEIGLKRWIR